VFWVGGSQDRVADPVTGVVDPVAGVVLEEVELPLDGLVAATLPLEEASMPPPQPASSARPMQAARRWPGTARHIAYAGCLIASMPN
jgi:hypothetical protein